jgi:predicted small integral membrane protein
VIILKMLEVFLDLKDKRGNFQFLHVNLSPNTAYSDCLAY